MEVANKRRKGTRGTPRSAAKPQASEKEKEPPLTEESYEALKLDFLRRAVLCENQYVLLRNELKEVRYAEIAEQRAKVERGECEYYLAEKEKAEKERQRKHDINRAQYELKMAQVEDEYEAEMAMNSTKHEDKYAYAKGRYTEFFEQLIIEKERRKREVDQIMAALLILTPRPTARTSAPILKESIAIYEGRQTRSRSKSVKNTETASSSDV